ILARLTSAQRTARLPPPQAAPLAPAAPARADRLQRFVEELGALGVETHVAASADDLRRRVAERLEGKRVLSWDSDRLPYDLGSLLRGATRGCSPREEQAQAEIGLTGVDAAIAETGTLALLARKGQSRAVSLLPPVHLAVVRPDQLVFSMGEFFAAFADRLGEAAACTFITGPSRTA